MADNAIPVYTENQVNQNLSSDNDAATRTTVTATTADSRSSIMKSNIASATDQYLTATESNILHKYRSWTYNFALGAVSQPKELLMVLIKIVLAGSTCILMMYLLKAL